jgi:hypothetical protein
MSEYANGFEQTLDGIARATINENNNINDTLENMDSNFQTYIIESNLVQNITNNIINAINSGDLDNHYYDDLSYLYPADLMEITVLFLRLATTFVSNNNRNESVNRIQQYVSNLREQYSDEQINTVVGVLRLSMMSLVNENNMVIDDNVIDNNIIDNNIDYINVFEYENRQNETIRNIGVFVRNETTTETPSECPVCYNEFESVALVKTNCNHLYCKECIVHHVSTFVTRECAPTCPFCRDTITYVSLTNAQMVGEVIEQFANI